MPLPYYEVHAFTGPGARGNPAGVCPLPGDFLPDAVMQAIAADNNLAETAFLRAGGGPDTWAIRWFAPGMEIPLCGHATLASAEVLWRTGRAVGDTLRFDSLSGPLGVTRAADGMLWLDFPERPTAPAPLPPALAPALGAAPLEFRREARFLLAVFPDASAVRALRPDFRALAEAGLPLVIATAPGDAPGLDFVSRFFAAVDGIDEDPVTGSAHCALVPYWAERLGRDTLAARQASPRGGVLQLERRPGGRIGIGGRATPYLDGFIRAAAE